MRFHRLFIALLLALFCVGTVYAASMGIALEPFPSHEMPMSHCHDVAGGGGHQNDHADHGHKAACAHCAACMPLMPAAQVPTGALATVTAQNPHREADYVSFVSLPSSRPPIAA